MATPSQPPTLSPRAKPPDPVNTSSPAASSTSSLSVNATLSPRPELSPISSSNTASHRSSFTDNLRYPPPSPRAKRNHSFSGSALTDLLMKPAGGKTHGADARFAGRDWRSVQVHEIIDPDGARFVELDTSVEDTTKLLVRSGAPNVVLVRESRRTKTAIGLFTYDDLNAYLLLVLGMSQPDEQAKRIAEQARNGEVLPLRDIRDHLGSAEEPVSLPHTADLTRAVEVLGSGVHRAVICKEGTSEAVGVLSQLRLVQFFWENHQNFAPTEALYGRTLQDLKIGAKEVLSINGDRPLSDALRMMHDGGITSLPVLDSHSNVVGNISHVDVRLLTDTSSIPLLSSSCIHFVSVILSERGVEDGKDAYPVHYVTGASTLAHTVAKLCATRSHRMWIVESPSPSSSIPPSPSVAPAQAVSPGALQQGGQQGVLNPPHLPPPPSPSKSSPTTASAATANGGPNSPISLQIPPTTGPASTRPNRAGSNTSLSSPSDLNPGPPFTSLGPGVAISASQLPGVAMSGRLSGVVSLTDVLNLFARASGLKPLDPEETRRRRRRSSSSSSAKAGALAEALRGQGQERLRGSSASRERERARGQ